MSLGLGLALLMAGCEQTDRLPTQVDPAAQDGRASTKQGYNVSQLPPSALVVPESRVLRTVLPSSLVENGSFENNGGEGTSDFPGWTVWNQPGGSGSWYAQTGSLSPTTSLPVPPPPHGDWAAMTDQFGPGSHILYQDVGIPAAGAELRFDLFIGNRADAFHVPATLDYNVFPNQQFRMDVMDPAAGVNDVGDGVLRMVYRTEPGDPLISGYQTITASLDEYAGQTIRLRFAEVDNQGNFQVGIDNVQVTPRDEIVSVDIHAVFSGPPNRDPNQISLEDPTVFVQILDVEQYLPRQAVPGDVRIGDDWETGTPAQEFTILDINNDGSRDIQLRFSTQALINAGHLGPNTTEITVWGRDQNSGQLYRGVAQVEIIGGEPPPSGMVVGRVVNALTAEPIAGATIDFGGGRTTTTGAGGSFSIDLPPGTFTAEVSAAGFIPTTVTDIEVNPAETTDVGTIALSPVLGEGEVRIVLTWNVPPSRDLDSHLTGPIPGSMDRFHVYFGNRGNLNGSPWAALDRDDLVGPGPETITIARLFPGVYRYSVHDYTGRNQNFSTALAEAGARVRVFRGDEQIGDFAVPNRDGTLWTVFEMDGATGAITPINAMTYHQNPGTITRAPGGGWQADAARIHSAVAGRQKN
jgi:hypothetical protein